MTLFDFLRLIYRNLKVLVLIPVLMAVSVYFLTDNLPKEYASESMIYTGIASGYNIESGEGDKVDYHATNNAFDNLLTIIKSRHTLEEVGLKLLAQHLHELGEDSRLTEETAYLLSQKFPESSRDKYVAENEKKTFDLLRLRYAEGDKLLTQLIRKETTPYSVKTLNAVNAKRHKSSDMLILHYTSNDPWICQQSLVFLIEVFSRRYREVKEAETGDVVAYFEAELGKTKNKLNDAEDRLTEFRVKSQVINYGEQTKAIAIKKENAMEEYSNKKMKLKATEAALGEIESKLSIRDKLLAKNSELLDEKNRLVSLTGDLAKLETHDASDSLIMQKSNEIESVRDNIQRKVEEIFQFSNTKEGLPSRQLLTEWLDNIIQLNKEKVYVDLYSNRLEDLDSEYDRFAPMGSTIARLEREINVFEREYLEILHGLNMSKLRQQNIEMSSNLEVVDWPLMATDPLPSKRMILLIASFMFGLIAPLSIIIAADLLDHSLRSPAKAEAITGLEVAGALPVLNEKFNANYSDLLPKLAGQLASNLDLEDSSNRLITIFSALPGEGKSTVSGLLFNELKKRGSKVMMIKPATNEASEDDVFSYTEFRQSRETIQELIGESVEYTYKILELPAFSEGFIPTEFIHQSDISFMIGRGDRVWSRVHQNALRNYRKVCKNREPLLVVNGVKLYYLDQLLGEVPLKRVGLVRWIRKIVRFELTPSQFKTA
ncbi:GumC family protein [Ekhidna sp.]|uniref:GumC family protein n=1 Tax=Ekhidna sp. TaxID=2608089 RepID=UPI003CCBAFAB